MDTVLLLARLLLATVFAVAGIAKLVDAAGSRRALEGFGVPARFAAPGAIALPLAELIVAVLLVPRATAWWGGLGALLLLLVFVAGIGYNLSRGRTPDCHCFGQLHSEPVGWRTLIRNGLLAAVAAVVVAAGWGDPGPSVVAWLGDLSTGETVALVLAAVAAVGLAAVGWLVANLIGQNGRVLLRLDEIEAKLSASGSQVAPATPVQARQGLPEDTPAPAFRLGGLHDEVVTLDALRAAGKPVFLIFSDPGCGPCNTLLPEIGRWQRDHASRLTIAVVSRGTAAANQAKSAEHGIANVLVQQDREVAQAYQANGTPSAVLVRADGAIGSPLAAGAEAIRALLGKATTSSLPSPTVVIPTRPVPVVADVPARQNGTAPVGAKAAVAVRPASPVELPDLAGNMVRLADFAGSPTLVLFWNPGCGFCQRMLPDLRRWEAEPPPGAPKLLVVSTGSVEANAAQGLSAPVVLDQSFATGSDFGARGTPSAILIDGDGQIASELAVGAPNVLSLAYGDTEVPPHEDPIVESVELAIGEPAPELRLPDLGGRTVDLAEFRGDPTLVLFWNPSCSFCGEMIEKLRHWEETPPPDAPKLLVVSSGTPEEHETFGLRAPVALDQGFATGRAFGASGTPSAILVDGDGRIASQVAAGANEVLTLAGYVSPACASCLEDCKGRGGGSACRSVCEMGGQCP